MTELYIQDRINALLDCDSFLLSNITPSDWAEAHRVMTTEVSFNPGPFKYDTTPYLKEIVNRLMSTDPSQQIAVMKGAQLGFSTGVIENGIGYLMAESPCKILLAARDEDLVKKMVDDKIDQMIDSCGLRRMIRPNVIRARNQRTGDTSTVKEFAGGRMEAYSIQTPGKMRQISMKVGFLDDFEAAPVDKKAGDAPSLFRTRFKSFGDSKKIFWISTPEKKHTSNIEGLYLQGDQRKYFVPCPCCGDFITLEWSTLGKGGKKAGITWKINEEKKLIEDSVGYTCQSCNEFFTDGYKREMNLAGEWRATAKQDDSTFFSYHLNCLYAPLGMDDWLTYVREYLSACPPGGRIDIPKYQTFTNTCLGLTWEERGRTPHAAGLALNTRDYDIGIIPEQKSIDEGNGSIVLITCACDLGGEDDDARIDYEIVAWSERGASYSIDHGSVGTFIPRENTLKKKVDRERWTYHFGEDKNVWDPMVKIVTKQYETDIGGGTREINIFGVDSGKFTLKAYDFVDMVQNQGVYSVSLKGKGELKHRNIDANTRIYSPARERSNLYLVEVNQVKDELSGAMRLRWVEGDAKLQPMGFMNFPTPSDNKYTMKSFFIQYEAERKIMKSDPSGRDSAYIWEKKNSNAQNHFWDCRVYNTAIREIMMDLVCKEHKRDSNWHTFAALITGNANRL